MKTLQLKNGTKLLYVGPSVDAGKLPAVFYFALSAEASLNLDPYNQVVQFLPKENIRIFSCSLPYHTDTNSFTHAISHWASDISTIVDFIEMMNLAINELIQEGIVDPTSIAVAGLSRGGFIATQIAAKNKHIHTLLAFAPVTTLRTVKEFAEIKETDEIKLLDLTYQAQNLTHKSVRFYIGNRDTRVSTEECFKFIHTLAEANYQKNNRASPVELIIGPSHGHMGHGTQPETFKDGADWLMHKLTS